MSKKNRGVLRLFAVLYFAISAFVFIVSYNNEFADNGYRFDFTNMHNPEHAVIGMGITIFLIILTYVWKKK